MGLEPAELILDPVDRALTAEDVTIDFWYGSHKRFGTQVAPSPGSTCWATFSPQARSTVSLFP